MTLPRVIFVNRVYRPSQAATAQILADLAESLVAQGWRVEVIASGDSDAIETLNGVIVHRVRGANRHGGAFGKLRSYLKFLMAVRRLLPRVIATGDIVILKTDPPLLAAFCTSLAKAHGAHVVQWIQDIYPEIIPLHFGSWTAPLISPLRIWRNRAWRISDACVPVGDDMSRTVHAAGVGFDRIAVHPNPAPRELDITPTPEEVTAIRCEWQVEGKFVVAYSGNLGRVHEFETFLKAAAYLRSDDRFCFLFIGDGPRFAEVKRATKLQALHNVRFVPAQPRQRLSASLAAADVHLVSLHQGFEQLVHPSKIAGIQAAARPILFVGSAASSIAMMLESEQCGLAFAVGDGVGLAVALQQLRGDCALSAAFGKAARATYAQGLTSDASAARWAGLFSQLRRQ